MGKNENNEEMSRGGAGKGKHVGSCKLGGMQYTLGSCVGAITSLTSLFSSEI